MRLTDCENETVTDEGKMIMELSAPGRMQLTEQTTVNDFWKMVIAGMAEHPRWGPAGRVHLALAPVDGWLLSRALVGQPGHWWKLADDWPTREPGFVIFGFPVLYRTDLELEPGTLVMCRD